MPTVNVYTKSLFELVGREFSTFKDHSDSIAAQEFENLCFEFGIELEEVVG